MIRYSRWQCRRRVDVKWNWAHKIKQWEVGISVVSVDKKRKWQAEISGKLLSVPEGGAIIMATTYGRQVSDR